MTHTLLETITVKPFLVNLSSSRRLLRILLPNLCFCFMFCIAHSLGHCLRTLKQLLQNCFPFLITKSCTWTNAQGLPLFLGGGGGRYFHSLGAHPRGSDW